jgi:adenylate cyclase, class 1
MVNEMKPDTHRRSSAVAELMARRSAFSAYNISRIRELIRYLPKKKYFLFQQIPLWLHLNRPRTPGFVGDPRAPFGIYRFRESGFWKRGLSQLNLTEKQLRPFLSSREYILGLYLMGSSGTLAQTDASDFDYWVVIDGEGMEPVQKRLLKLKLESIEAYCADQYGQMVSFFVLEGAQVRANRFEAVDEESSGSAQRTLLKEEFYRTFIMIAGKIPYWAVLPSGLDDDQYRRRIDEASAGWHVRFDPEDYIDLGNLAALNHRESLGALLWQIYKARHSPVKSLIKAALIAHYFFSREDGFLCDAIKARVFEGCPGDWLVDPYALMFEKGLAFFTDLEDQEGLSLLKESIFLRLSGHRPLPASPGGSPREMLLRDYLRRWEWAEKRIHHMSFYRQWPEAEKRRFESAVFEKISHLYELILKGKDRDGAAIDMTDRDLQVLTNRIAGHFRQVPGKIPKCSSYTMRNAAALQIIVAGESSEGGNLVWSVYGREGRRAIDSDALLFEGPELLKTAAWLISNNLYTGKTSVIGFQAASSCEVTGHQARRIVQRAYDFFKDGMAGLLPSEQPPSWKNLLVCLHRTEAEKERRLARADFLVMNTWGEFFFDGLDLLPIENETLACYTVSEHIWIFLKEAPSFDLRYQMIQPKGAGSDQAEKTVGRYLEQFKENALDKRTLGIPSEKSL